MIIAIDIGNTRVKLGLFEGHELQEVLVFVHAALPEALLSHPLWTQIRERLQYLGLASVGREEMAQKLLQCFGWLDPAKVVQITHRIPMPIGNAYHSPQTLGIDRLCVAVAAKAWAHLDPVLAIDAGSAITYDLVDAHGDYQGGGIAPGIQMRFKALNTFTARLPLIIHDPAEMPDLLGRDTEACMRSGVVNGVIAELEGTIARYRETFGARLKVVLTGGDSPFLRNHLKNHNFADAFLLLRGIHLLIRHNVQVP